MIRNLIEEVYIDKVWTKPQGCFWKTVNLLLRQRFGVYRGPSAARLFWIKWGRACFPEVDERLESQDPVRRSEAIKKERAAEKGEKGEKTRKTVRARKGKKTVKSDRGPDAGSPVSAPCSSAGPSSLSASCSDTGPSSVPASCSGAGPSSVPQQPLHDPARFHPMPTANSQPPSNAGLGSPAWIPGTVALPALDKTSTVGSALPFFRPQLPLPPAPQAAPAHILAPPPRMGAQYFHPINNVVPSGHFYASVGAPGPMMSQPVPVPTVTGQKRGRADDDDAAGGKRLSPGRPGAGQLGAGSYPVRGIYKW